MGPEVISLSQLTMQLREGNSSTPCCHCLARTEKIIKQGPHVMATSEFLLDSPLILLFRNQQGRLQMIITWLQDAAPAIQMQTSHNYHLVNASVSMVTEWGIIKWGPPVHYLHFNGNSEHFNVKYFNQQLCHSRV